MCRISYQSKIVSNVFYPIIQYLGLMFCQSRIKDRRWIVSLEGSVTAASVAMSPVD